MTDGPAPNQTTIRHGLYLTTGRTEDGRLIAICADGTPLLGHDPVTVLTLECVQSIREAKQWFKKVKLERPWETRH